MLTPVLERDDAFSVAVKVGEELLELLVSEVEASQDLVVVEVTLELWEGESGLARRESGEGLCETMGEGVHQVDT